MKILIIIGEKFGITVFNGPLQSQHVKKEPARERADLEKRIAQLEKAQEVNGKLKGIEHLTLKLGAAILLILTVLALILTKLADLIDILVSL